MRQFIRRRAVEHGLDSAETFRAQLVATEAVTNAIRHGTSTGANTPISVTCRWHDNGFAIEVGDRGRFRRSGPPAPLAESGRGLGLIERLTREFELETSESGTKLRMLVGQAA
jgi:anti-sigma regulatory factor (Ser/Thr protein kinase)